MPVEDHLRLKILALRSKAGEKVECGQVSLERELMVCTKR